MRPTWDEWFMSIARTASTRATCDRAHVGCVIAKHNQVLSVGYNGSPPKEPHCDDEGHQMVNGHCVRTRHAEFNALLNTGAPPEAPATKGATCYVTHHPCITCAVELHKAGITRVVVGMDYGSTSTEAREFLDSCGIEVVHLSEMGMTETKPPGALSSLRGLSSHSEEREHLERELL